MNREEVNGLTLQYSRWRCMHFSVGCNPPIPTCKKEEEVGEEEEDGTLSEFGESEWKTATTKIQQKHSKNGKLTSVSCMIR